MTPDITFEDLEVQSVELLPARAALSQFGSNWASVWASNTALALNAGALHSHAHATALQWINVSQ